MYPCKIFWKNHIFHSSESVYQYEKALMHGQFSLAERIKKEHNPYRCKQMTKTIRVSDQWKACNVTLMYRILRVKFFACREYSKDITKYNYFVEDTHNKFWGRSGSNMLGRLHLKIKMNVAV